MPEVDMHNPAPCPNCRGPVIRRRLPSGKLEQLRTFQVRIFCSQACKHDHGRMMRGLPPKQRASG